MSSGALLESGTMSERALVRRNAIGPQTASVSQPRRPGKLPDHRPGAGSLKGQASGFRGANPWEEKGPLLSHLCDLAGNNLLFGCFHLREFLPFLLFLWLKNRGMGLVGKCLDFLQLENIPDRISISSFFNSLCSFSSFCKLTDYLRKSCFKIWKYIKV